MEKITTHLWFDKEAKEAADFYIKVFNSVDKSQSSKIINHVLIHDTPSGSVDIIDLQVLDHQFTLINAGPIFKLNPSVSFLISCKTKEEVDELWNKLIEGGFAMMELMEYPFSERYGWLQDKFGLSWQFMCVGDKPITQKIIPSMMFVGDVAGKAEEAVNFYTSIFKNSKIGDAMRYGKGEEPDKEGTLKYMSFTLEGKEFAAMDSAHKHGFAFGEAISFVVRCEDQAEIDYFWEKLSAVPESEQCGWLKDKYGHSWQIVPRAMDKMMKDKDEEKLARVTQAFLKMKKFDIEKLEKAYRGE
jgi:predicted 3-demethylubiquinone-9 3-methyltransferase (glyoxalase superfamily)